MAENIFNEKQDYIVAARDEVIKRDEYAANIDRMKQQQKKLSRSIASEEKSIADEIATTIKKRRQDIQSTYDDRLDDNRARKKKVANKRDKKKEERMDKRYHEETKSLRESDKDLKVEMQTLLRKYKLPSFCGKKLYFALFYARNVRASARIMARSRASCSSVFVISLGTRSIWLITLLHLRMAR